MPTRQLTGVIIQLMISYDIHEDIMTVTRHFGPRCLFTDIEALEKCSNWRLHGKGTGELALKLYCTISSTAVPPVRHPHERSDGYVGG